jgi:hypothetical protein
MRGISNEHKIYAVDLMNGFSRKMHNDLSHHLPSLA